MKETPVAQPVGIADGVRPIMPESPNGFVTVAGNLSSYYSATNIPPEYGAPAASPSTEAETADLSPDEQRQQEYEALVKTCGRVPAEVLVLSLATAFQYGDETTERTLSRALYDYQRQYGVKAVVKVVWDALP